MLADVRRKALHKTRIGVLAARSARGLRVIFAPLQVRGRRECRMRAAPAVSCANLHKKMRTRAYRAAEAIRHPLRNGLRLMARSPRRSGFFVTVALGKLASQELDASVKASGPHVFTVRFRAVRQRRIRVHRSLPHVRDDGQRPSSRDRMASDMPLICPAGKAEF